MSDGNVVALPNELPPLRPLEGKSLSWWSLNKTSGSRSPDLMAELMWNVIYMIVF